MMSSKVWMLLVLSFGLSACSGNKKASSVSPETPQIELTDATGEPTDEFVENTTPGDELVAASPSDSALETELSSADDSAPIIAAEEPVVAEEPAALSTPSVSTTGVNGEYIVQKNETLMMVAFKLYGDYGKWRDLASRNSGTLKGGPVRAGMKIKYDMPSESFSWSPQGNPHLIRTGDTLGKISSEKYGTVKKWKSLWDNNRPLIKNPNRIFAGFTIYWLELGKVAQSGRQSSLEL